MIHIGPPLDFVPTHPRMRFRLAKAKYEATASELRRIQRCNGGTGGHSRSQRIAELKRELREADEEIGAALMAWEGMS